MTINSFFGISFATVNLEKIDFSDFSEYDVFVFDDVYFTSRNVYWEMKEFVQNNRGKIGIGTGDALQLNQFRNCLTSKTIIPML